MEEEQPLLRTYLFISRVRIESYAPGGVSHLGNYLVKIKLH